MVDDLLEISRFDAGSAELSLDEVDPGELVRRAVAAAAPVGVDGVRGSVSIPVEVGPGVDGLRLAVDKRRFERVMANLVENATFYAGGVTRVAVERQPGRVAGVLPPADAIRVSVEDHGPGVPEAERPHLFERFYRGVRAGHRASGQGTGLGLSLVAEHVRLHGGRVWSEGIPGGGTRFVVELPLLPERIGVPTLLPGDTP
jgi:signal transduction histidine kinase